jgi:hypothetical protein
MKTRSPLAFQFWSISTALLISLSALAEVTVSVAPSAVDPAKLPYGVADVLKLSRAQVSEQVIATYVQNSGTAYNLNPNEIVYLRDQGVSEHIINIMLEQRKRMIESLPQTPAAQQPAPAYANTTAAPQTYAQPTQTYAPASTVHVIPYPAASYAYYNSTPYYSSYYPYYSSGYYPYYSSSYCSPYYGGYYGGYYGYRPSLSFSFGFGGYGGYGHGRYHGSYGHGGHHGGSYGHGGHHGSSGHHGGGIHAVSRGSGHSGGGMHASAGGRSGRR